MDGKDVNNIPINDVIDDILIASCNPMIGYLNI